MAPVGSSAAELIAGSSSAGRAEQCTRERRERQRKKREQEIENTKKREKEIETRFRARRVAGTTERGTGRLCFRGAFVRVRSSRELYLLLLFVCLNLFSFFFVLIFSLRLSRLPSQLQYLVEL